MISTCVISGIAAVLSFVGAILDGIDNDIVKSLEACASGPSTLNSADITLYGNSDYFSTASLCYINNVQTYYYQCYCVNTNYGVTSGFANECYLYDGQSDCTNILVGGCLYSVGLIFPLLMYFYLGSLPKDPVRCSFI